jgi:glycerophosphoryl diester phosphodiesterase
VFLPENETEILKFIQDTFQGKLGIKPDLKSPSEFERKATTQQLAELLKSM